MEENPTPKQRLKIGDVGSLKSGGPKMTVVKLGKGGLVECEWFDTSHAIHAKAFPRAAVAAKPMVQKSEVSFAAPIVYQR